MSPEEFCNKYFDLISGPFAGLNLTHIPRHEFMDKQFTDSLEPVGRYLEKNPEVPSLFVDIGFGGGFPLLPMAWKYPGSKVLGFEARRKKAVAVQTIAEEMNLKNVETNHLRVEQLLFDKPCLITLKAVGNCRAFLEKIHCAHEDVRVLFYKGPQFYQQEFAETEKMDLWERFYCEDYQLKNTDKRTVVAFKPLKINGNFKNDLVKVSSFI